MSICCAFSFSLIFLFGFGFFPWAGVGEACAGVVEYIYIYFILFFFSFRKAFSRAVGFLLFLQFLSVQGLPQGCVGVCVCLCVYPLLAPDAAPCSSWSSGSGCLAFFSVYFRPQIFTCPNAALCSQPCTQDTCSDPRGGVCVSVCVSVCVFRGLCWIPRQDKEGCSAPLLQRLPARFRLWIFSPSPFHLSNGPFLAVLIFTSL